MLFLLIPLFIHRIQRSGEPQAEQPLCKLFGIERNYRVNIALIRNLSLIHI